MSQSVPPPTSGTPTEPTAPPKRGVVLKTAIPGPKAQAVIARDQAILMRTTKTAPIVAESGSGVWITDVDGNRLLDFSSAVAVNNVGYAHPEVVRAVREQVGRLSHFAGTDYYYEAQVGLAERIAKIVPGNFEKKIFFTNSGTESAEAALKIARWQRQKPIVIGLLGAFHGRTMGALSMTTSKPVQRARYAPFVTGGHHTPGAELLPVPVQARVPQL